MKTPCSISLQYCQLKLERKTEEWCLDPYVSNRTVLIVEIRKWGIHEETSVKNILLQSTVTYPNQLTSLLLVRY